MSESFFKKDSEVKIIKEIKICKECCHYCYSSCGSYCLKYLEDTNIVTGEKSYLSCVSARHGRDKCGMEAKHWSKKLNFIEKIKKYINRGD